MRYLSDIFKEKQNKLIRSPLELFFEVDTFAMNSLLGGDELGLDDTVAPIVRPRSCTNEYYYAVLGDGTFVNDPNKICAPEPNNVFTEPTHSVPYGVSVVADVNEEVIIGSETYQYNFVGIDKTIGISFKGGLIPEYLRVERYDTANNEWIEEETIDNTSFHDVIYFTPLSAEYALSYRRFVVWNTETSGRYQLNWVNQLYTDNHNSIIFENNRISSVVINQETDLTSQTLPSYEMTVTCLDVDKRYSPESTYWKDQFKCGTPCYFRIGYRGVAVESIPLMYGKLAAEPTYSQGKITFKVAVDWKTDNEVNLISLPDDSLNSGDEVDGRTFEAIINSQELFDSADVFHGGGDSINSKCNHYGALNSKEARQLVANALGCFITANLNLIDLHNTNDIQYEAVDNYLTRYDQSVNTLATKPKVADIEIIRNQNVLSDDYLDVVATERVIAFANRSTEATFILPFYAIGKMELVDAQASVATVTIEDIVSENVISDGTVEVIVSFRSNNDTTILPIVRFYRVDRNEFKENETVDTEASENYINDNILITNSYTAGKAKRVAQMISDISNQYEVDVIQNFSHEIGDIIKLETDKGVYKTCVITGLKFNLPGSKGHVTCRKIFSIEDSEKALSGLEYVTLIESTGGSGVSFRITETINGSFVMGKMYDEETEDYYFIFVGATAAQRKPYGLDWVNALKYPIRDYNNHSWVFYRVNAIDTDLAVDIPYYDLGSRPADDPVALSPWGCIKLVMTLYEEQGMTSPLDWDNFIV